MSSSEAYQGDLIKQCQQFKFGDANAVVVSGSSWNPCGHMLLNTGGPNGYYFHIAEVKGRPRYMDHDGYKRYLEENDKREQAGGTSAGLYSNCPSRETFR